MSNLTRIGTITNKAETVRRTMEQTACNFYEITVAARTEAVLYLDTRGDLFWSFAGTCTDERWVNRLFHATSVRAEKPDVGKPMDDRHHRYGYELLALMLGGVYTIVLDEGCEVTAEVKTSGDDRYRHTSVFARIVPPSPLYSKEVA